MTPAVFDPPGSANWPGSLPGGRPPGRWRRRQRRGLRSRDRGATLSGVAFRFVLLTTSGATANSSAFVGTLFIMPSHRPLTVVLGAHVGGVPTNLLSEAPTGCPPARAGRVGHRVAQRPARTDASPPDPIQALRTMWHPAGPPPDPAPSRTRGRDRLHGQTAIRLPEALQHRLGPPPAARDTWSRTARSTDVAVGASIVLVARGYIDRPLEHLLYSETGPYST